MVSAKRSRERSSLSRRGCRWRHVDGVAVATSTGCKVQCDVLLQACVASTALRLRAAAPRAGTGCGCSVRCCQLLSQLSHGSATSSSDGSAVIIMNARVSAGMVANALRFHGVLVLYRELSVIWLRRAATRDRESPAGSVRTQTSATHAKTHPASRTSARRPPLTSQRHQTEAASRAPDAKGRTSRRPTDYQETKSDRRRAATAARRPLPAAPPNKRAASRPPEV